MPWMPVVSRDGDATCRAGCIQWRCLQPSHSWQCRPEAKVLERCDGETQDCSSGMSLSTREMWCFTVQPCAVSQAGPPLSLAPTVAEMMHAVPRQELSVSPCSHTSPAHALALWALERCWVWALESKSCWVLPWQWCWLRAGRFGHLQSLQPGTHKTKALVMAWQTCIPSVPAASCSCWLGQWDMRHFAQLLP